MEQLKFKNALHKSIYTACVITVLAIIIILCVIIAYITEFSKDITNVLIVGAVVILGIWMIFGIVVLFSSTVIVDATEIKLCRGIKVKWCIQKDELNKCIHNGALKWWCYLFPSVMDSAFIMSFNLKGKGLSRKKSCSLSYKQVMKIKKMFDYPIVIIDE